MLPAEALALFPQGVAYFSAWSEGRRELRAGDWVVTSYAYVNGVFDTGRTASGQFYLN